MAENNEVRIYPIRAYGIGPFDRLMSRIDRMLVDAGYGYRQNGVPIVEPDRLSALMDMDQRRREAERRLYSQPYFDDLVVGVEPPLPNLEPNDPIPEPGVI